MGRFISDAMLAREADKKKRGNLQFLSSKDDSETAFRRYFGKEFEVVGLSEATVETTTFNTVVIRQKGSDVNQQLSTTKFFAMRGIVWPVGVVADKDKLQYLDGAIGSKTLNFTPRAIERVIPTRKKGESFEYYSLADGGGWKPAKKEDVDTEGQRAQLKLDKAPENAFIAVTYVADSVTFEKL